MCLVLAQPQNIGVDPKIIAHVEEVISSMDEYTGKAGCMAQKIIDEKNVNEFYASDLLVNHEQLKDVIQPYLEDARSKCENNVIEKSKQWLSVGFKKVMEKFSRS